MASPTRAPGGTPRGEDPVVRRIAEVFEQAVGLPAPGEVWIGDDAAVLGVPSGPLVFATDAVVGGVHADLSLTGLDDLGWKALTATVSDIGAVGGRPTYAVVTFCVPRGTDVVLLATGVAEAAREWRCHVVGGDVTSAPEVMVSIAAVGVLDGDGPPVLRSGASAGDTLFVTGPLGASAAGLRLLRARARARARARGRARAGGAGGSGRGDRKASGSGAAAAAAAASVAAAIAAHRRPSARLAEGVLARRAGASAMMDVSDGLGIDLHRFAEASGVGVALEEVPVAEGSTAEEALGGGEDFELVIATPDPARLTAAFAAAGLRPPLEIGRCTAEPGERSLRGGELGRAGFEHQVD